MVECLCDHSVSYNLLECVLLSVSKLTSPEDAMSLLVTRPCMQDRKNLSTPT